ncbi:MAG: sulfatase [Phycisphaeraceae bacterium]|nr:sulfatase [Phycisphaeraceae bacterium]
MSDKKLNVIYLNSHDTGRWLGCYGEDVHTPAIDQLASQGVRMTQMFSLAPICSPSRAALLTGQYPHQTGLLGNTGRGFELLYPQRHLAAHLKSHGYHTAHVGIFSLYPTDPMGYDVINPDFREAEKHAIDLIEQYKDDDAPFFLDVGFMEAHRTPGRDNINFYASDDVPAQPFTQDITPPASMADLEDVKNDWQDFKRSARSLDQRIGKILQALDQAGLAEKTVVIYTTDHGPAIPDMKGTLCDNGIGVAMIMRGPLGSVLTGGITCEALLSQIDWYPTLCELLDIPQPSWLEGHSFLPLLKDSNATPPRDAIFAEQTYHAAYEPLRAVRTQRYKYIQAYHDYPTVIAANCDDSPSKTAMINNGWLKTQQGSKRFYDLASDPQEAHNLIDDPAYASIIQEMQQKLADWQKQTDDPILQGPIALPQGVTPISQSALSPWDGR